MLWRDLHEKRGKKTVLRIREKSALVTHPGLRVRKRSRHEKRKKKGSTIDPAEKVVFRLLSGKGDPASRQENPREGTRGSFGDLTRSGGRKDVTEYILLGEKREGGDPSAFPEREEEFIKGSP